VRSRLYSGLWRTALLGTQEVLALPVSFTWLWTSWKRTDWSALAFLCRCHDMVNSERVRRLSVELISRRSFTVPEL
jgi:hypothetical protein